MDFSETPPYLYEEWIARLHHDIDASITVPKTKESRYIVKSMFRKLGVRATAYLDSATGTQKQVLMTAIPELHKEFQQLTGYSLKVYLNGKTGSKMKNYTQEKLATDFIKAAESDVGGIGYFSGGDQFTSKQSSPNFALNVMLDFDSTMDIYSHFSVDVPYSWWQKNRESFDKWWQKVLHILKPQQAYMGITYSYPLDINQFQFHYYAEYKLARAFYGFDIDKPFFMVSSIDKDGMHLEEGLRTPTYGILLQGKWLEIIGGRSAVTRALDKDTDFKMIDVDDGIWIESTKPPALYPVEEGVPLHLQRLYKLVKPAVLDKLWMVSLFYPPVPDLNTFTPEESSRWLKRFEEESDWPSSEIRTVMY